MNTLVRDLGIPTPETLVDLFEGMSGNPDDAFVTIESLDRTFSRGEFNDRVRRLATGLKQLGVSRGDRVAAVLDNGIAILEGWFAVMSLGAIWVPANTALRGSFLVHVLNDCRAEIVIVEADLMKRVADVATDLGDVKTIVRVADSNVATEAAQAQIDGMQVLAIDNLRASDPMQSLDKAKGGDIAAFIYTSGTTGASKGCMLPHSFIVNMAHASRSGRNCGEPLYTTLPIFHLNAMLGVVMTLVLGCRITIGHRFSVSNFWTSIEKSRAKFVNLLGPMITMIANAPDNDAMLRCRGQLRKILAAPFPAEIREVCRERFGVVEFDGVGAYGLTETGPITLAPPGVDEPANSSGTRTSWIDVEVVDDEDNVLAVGEIGEVICRPKYPNLMFVGYWGRPQATVDACRNLWFHTGDLGRFDEQGFFYFEDRKKDYLRRRGENISSMEVEHTFHQHPDVAEVACYGVASDLGEDDVQISVVLRKDATVTEEALCHWSLEKLPYFAVPRYIEFISEMPKSVVGRVRKVDLRNRSAEYPRWDREISDVQLDRR